MTRCTEDHDRTSLEDHGKTSIIPVPIDHNSKRSTSKSTTIEGTFICRLCQATFLNEKLIKNHFNSDHPGILPFQCSNCYSEFDSNLNKSKHNCCKIKSEEFECVICYKKLPTYNQLYFHISKEHSQKDSICKVCNKMFPNGEALRDHRLSHKEGKRFACAFCSKSYRNSQYLTLHMKGHTSSQVLKCKICFRAFLNKNLLFQHMLFHASMPGVDKSYTCCLCYSSFSQRRGLKFHIEQHHIGKQHKSKKCPVCEEVQDQNSMSVHIIRHCSRISANKMTKVETDWVKNKKSNCSQERLPLKTKSKVKAELQMKPSRNKHTSNSKASKTNIQTQIVQQKTGVSTTNEVSKINITKSNRLTNKKNSTLSNTIKSQTKKAESEEESNFEEDLALIIKRLEESSDSEFENGPMFLGFPVEPVDNLNASTNEDKHDIKKIQIEITDSSPIRKSEDFKNLSLIPGQERTDMLNPVKFEETLTNERPMSFLLVTSNNKTAFKSTSDKYNRENEKREKLSEITAEDSTVYRNEIKDTTASKSTSDKYNRENGKEKKLLEVSETKKAAYIKKLKESRIKIMLSNAIVNQKKLRSFTRKAKYSLHKSNKKILGKENLSLVNNSPGKLEELENLKHGGNKFEESKVTNEIKPSLNIEIKEDEQASIVPVTEESQPSLEKERKEVEQASKPPVTEKINPQIELKEIKQAFVNNCIQEKRYFEPSRNLSKHSCTTCLLSFSSQDELFVHSLEHII